MKSKEDIIEFCKIISKCYTYPIHYVFHDELCWERPFPPANLLSTELPFIRKNKASLHLHETPEDLVYGSVFSSEEGHLLIIGPVPLTPITFESIHRIMKSYNIPVSQKEALQDYLSRSSGYALPHLMNILSLINFFINHENETASHALLQQNNIAKKEIELQYINACIEEPDYSSFLAAYNYEKELLAYVKNGNMEGILNGSSTSADMHIGVLARTELRQMKNLFICMTTLVTRAAIEGGLPLKTAYHLSDLYLQKMESCSSISELKEINHSMLLDFTERTSKEKETKDTVPFDIFECLQYIRQNTHAPLRVEMLAAKMHLSKSQLNRKFKNTLGFSPSEFIIRCKLEEAKDLLMNTNRPISEISLLLCFSSQSHLTNTFKKKYGVSPMEYRKQKHS